MGANQECTIESSGRIDVNAGGQNNVGVELSAGSTLVNRGTITADSAVIDATFGFYYGSIAARITGAGSKVINYGNIYLFQTSGVGFSVLREASNAEIEFLSGSLIASKETGRHTIITTQGDSTNLTFGGTALISDAANSVFFRDSWGTSNVVILLPGAAIHKGDKRPLAGVTSDLFRGDDELKIGNFYDGDEPVGTRTGWVHAGQWNFGTGTDEILSTRVPV